VLTALTRGRPPGPCRGSGLCAASVRGRQRSAYALPRAAQCSAGKDGDYLHIPEGRCDHTTLAETLSHHGLD